MKKQSKVAVLLASMLCVLSFAACNFEDYIPDSYGEWDGYYVYCGNYRSKTTGEDGERLIQALTIDSKEYAVEECTDSVIVGDEMYVCLRVSSEDEEFTCLAAYDMAAKTQRLIYREKTVTEDGDEETYRARHILKVCENRIFLYEYSEADSFSVTQNGELQEGINLSSVFMAGDYLYYWRDDGLYCRTWIDATETVIMEGINTANLQVEYVKQEECDGLLITAYGEDQYAVIPWYFYDFSTRTLNEISGFPSGKIQWVTNANHWEYFLSYQEQTIEYEETWDLFKTVIRTQTVQTNCVLWRMDYSQSVPQITRVYTFDEDKDYTGLIGVDGTYCHVRAEWYEEAHGCNGGGMRNDFLRMNLTTGEVKKYRNEEALRDAVKTCKSLSFAQNPVRCGEYAYYVQWDALSFVWGEPNHVYQLKRTDGEKTDVMQLWACYDEESANYFAPMWDWKARWDGQFTADTFTVRAD